MIILSFLRYLRQKAESVSIRAKIMGILIFLLVFLGGGITLQTSVNMKKQLTSQLEERALSIAKDLSDDMGALMITGRLSTVLAKVENTVNNNLDISYIIIEDRQGSIIARFPNGAVIPESGTSPSNIKYEDGVYKSKRGGIINTAISISGEQGGVVWVGISDNRINREVWINIRRMLIFTGILSLLGISGGLYLTYILTRPLKELVGVTRAVAGGDLHVRAKISSDDDIGKLGKAFNTMIEDLDKWGMERQNLWNELKKREETRGQLLDKVIKAQEEERKRIARELHDETSQSMASLMVGLKMLEQEGDGIERKHMIRELREMASMAMDKVRDLALDLRPSSLDDLGLLTAVEQYTNDFGRRFGIKVDFQTVGFNGHRLSPEKETALYRIVQEALINVAKHSRATTAGVILEYRDSQVKAIIEDNGCGFEIEKINESNDEKRLGILGMLERAALIGGKLSIESSPGEGTAVFVEVPL